MANEKRLIYADALLEKLSQMIDYCKNDNKVSGLTALFQVGDAIMDCPTVDAVEVVHGRWIPQFEYDFDRGEHKLTGYNCDKCGIWNLKKSNYCPNCGAKMDGDGNG